MMAHGALLFLPRMHKFKPSHKLFLFVAGFIAINAFVTFAAFRYLPYDQNKRYRLEEEFTQLTDTLNFLFIGNSHVNRGLEPDSIPKSWSFHGPTETAPYFYYRMKRVVQEMPQAAHYYVFPGEAGLAAFNPQPLMFMGDFWKDYFDFTELAQHTNQPFFYYGMGLKLKLFPYHQFPAAIMFLSDLQRERRNYKKYLKDTWADYDQFMKDTILNYMLDRHELIDALSTETGLAYIHKMIDFAQEENVRLIFVKWPLQSVYIEEAKKRNFFTPKIEGTVDSLLKHSPQVRLIDFENAFDGNDTLFMDPHHLSKVGKARFSVMLRDTLSAIYEADFGVKP